MMGGFFSFAKEQRMNCNVQGLAHDFSQSPICSACGFDARSFVAPAVPSSGMGWSPAQPAAMEDFPEPEIRIVPGAWQAFRKALSDHVEGIPLTRTSELKKLRALLELYP